MSKQAWQAGSMDDGDGLWVTLWYTTYTTVRTAILTPLLYVIMVAAIRLTGSRAMAGITLFDRLAIVAMGSMLASTALRPTTPLVTYIMAVFIILLLQMAVDVLLYYKVFSLHFLLAKPRLIIANGHFLDDQIHELLLSRGKLYSMLRQKGLHNLKRVKYAVLEGNGALSIVMADEDEENWDADNDFSHDDLLDNVQGYTKLMAQDSKVSMDRGHSLKKHKGQHECDDGNV